MLRLSQGAVFDMNRLLELLFYEILFMLVQFASES